MWKLHGIMMEVVYNPNVSCTEAGWAHDGNDLEAIWTQGVNNVESCGVRIEAIQKCEGRIGTLCVSDCKILYVNVNVI